MFKKLFFHFWSMRHQFIRYFVIGLGAMVLDIGSLYVLKEYLHFRPVVAARWQAALSRLHPARMGADGA